MYKPCAPRPKKTNIVRKRSGCASCRRRRKKCDEAVPSCQRCIKSGIECGGYAVQYSFLDPILPPKRVKRDATSKNKGEIVKFHQIGNLLNDSATSQGHSSQLRLSHVRSPTTEPANSPHSAAFVLEASTLSSSQGAGISPSDEICLFSPHQETNELWNNATIDWNMYPKLPNPFIFSPQDLKFLENTDLGFDFNKNHARDHMYLAHFTNVVLGLLPANFLSIQSYVMECQVLKNAALALSAASLSKLEASVIETTDGGAAKKSFTLSQNHHFRAVEYYDLAVRSLHGFSASATAMNRDTAQSHLIAALLFSFFEWGSGSPRVFFKHITGADNIVLAMHDQITTTSIGKQVLSCWATLHARKCLHKLPFRPLSIETEREAWLEGSLTMRGLASTYANNHHDTILTILCKFYRMNARIVLEHCMSSGDESSCATIARAVDWYTELFGRPYSSELENRKDRFLLGRDELKRLLSHDRSRLDVWHDSLHCDYLPIETFTSRTVPRSSLSSYISESSMQGHLEIYPLVFRTHDTAVTYLYYSCAQLLASDQFLEQLSSAPQALRSELASPVHEIDRWAKIILRTIAGICDTDWFLREPYHLGVMWVLFTASLRCPEICILKYIIDCLIPRMYISIGSSALVVEIELYEKLFTLIHDQILAGREPLLVIPDFSQDRDRASVNHYQNTWAAVHGRHRDGQFFNDFVKVM